VLEISNIAGGFGVTTNIRNIGEVNASDVNIIITVTGGLFGKFDKSFTTGVVLITPSESTQYRAVPFRIGNIEILVTAEASNADQVTRQATGFLLGPFVLRLESLHNFLFFFYFISSFCS